MCAWCQSSGNTSHICLDCSHGIGVDGLTIGYRYDDRNVAYLLHALKYSFKESLSSELGTLLLTQSALDIEVDAIVPIPIDRVRQKERGFNQVEGMGRVLSRALKIPYRNDVLVRKPSRTTQAQLDAKDRWENMQDAYEVRHGREIPARCILLDDVTTTGATLSSASQVLRQAGVSYMYGVAFAHGTPPVFR